MEKTVLEAREAAADALDLRKRECAVFEYVAGKLKAAALTTTRAQASTLLKEASAYDHDKYVASMSESIQRFVLSLWPISSSESRTDKLARARLASAIVAGTSNGKHRWPLVTCAVASVRALTGSPTAADILGHVLGGTLCHHLDYAYEQHKDAVWIPPGCIVIVYDNIAKCYKGLRTARWVPKLVAGVVTNRIVMVLSEEEFANLQYLDEHAPWNFKPLDTLPASTFVASDLDRRELRKHALAYVATRLAAQVAGGGCHDGVETAAKTAVEGYDGVLNKERTEFAAPRHHASGERKAARASLPSAKDQRVQLPVIPVNPAKNAVITALIEKTTAELNAQDAPEGKRKWMFVCSDVGAMPPMPTRKEQNIHFILGVGHESMNLMRSLLKAGLAIVGDAVWAALGLTSPASRELCFSDTHKGREVLEVLRALITDILIVESGCCSDDAEIVLSAIEVSSKMNEALRNFVLHDACILDMLTSAVREERFDDVLCARRLALPWWWSRGHNKYGPIILEDLATHARCTESVRKARSRAALQDGKGTDFYLEEQNSILKALVNAPTARQWDIASRTRDTIEAMHEVVRVETGISTRPRTERTDSPYTEWFVARAKEAVKGIPMVYDISTEGKRRVAAAVEMLLKSNGADITYPPKSFATLVFVDSEAPSCLTDDELWEAFYT